MLIAKIAFTVPFHDIDLLEVAWHGHYAKYLELARTTLMRGLKLDVADLRDFGFAMPVVELEVSYRKALVYGGEYWVEARIEDCASPKLWTRYRILSLDESVVHARAATAQVYLERSNGVTAFEVPPEILKRMQGLDHANDR